MALATGAPPESAHDDSAVEDPRITAAAAQASDHEEAAP